MLDQLGLTVRGDIERDQVKFVSALLEKFGLGLKTLKGEYGSTYTVNAESVATMLDYSAPYLETILDPTGEKRAQNELDAVLQSTPLPTKPEVASLSPLAMIAGDYARMDVVPETIEKDVAA